MTSLGEALHLDVPQPPKQRDAQCYNTRVMIDLAEQKSFRPEVLSRQGELTAWVLAAVTIGVVAILRDRTSTSLVFSGMLAGFFTLAALGISFSNWVDRKTFLRLDARGVHFSNGLRNVKLSWAEIRSILVYPSNLGARVHVLGEQQHFNFRMLREVSVQGRVRGQTGFPDGEAILAVLLDRTGVKETDSPGPAQYYA